MEKKQNRSAQTPSKGTGTETKKNQDVSSGKCLSRGGRRRESVGGSIAFKTEPNRKSSLQRNKCIDKRPKARGGNYSGINNGKKDSGLTESDAELGSDSRLAGSKKQSLNHLLNFHYTPRERSDALVSHKKAIGPHRWLTTYKHKYNKEQYIQANCQFVVNSNGDYKLYLNDPDALVDWDLIEQIHVQVSDFPSCPICLYSPIAAKMTRCGHVYCWSCVLHYLSLSDKSWRKCPICYERVHKNDLKSVVAIPHTAFNVGEYISLRLMRRAQGTLTAIPVHESKIARNELLNLTENKINTVYSKLLLAVPAEVMSIIRRERSELTSQLKEDKHSPEKCFIEQAIAQLDEREKIVFNMSICYNCQIPDNFLETKEPKIGVEKRNVDGLNKLSKTPASNIDNGYSSTKYYYFYQAADGQHIYLHSLNIQMLERTYGSLENCPTTLNGRILEKECGSMTEELRRRLRYLQHLPVTCQFEVVEIQLQLPIVNKDTIAYYQEQIEIRKIRRHRRAREEKRREKRISEDEIRRIKNVSELNMHIESLVQFPQFEFERDISYPSSSTVDTSQSSFLMASLPQQEQFAGPTFAKMLATGKSPTLSWPKLHNPLPIATEPQCVIKVKQTKPIQQSRFQQSDSDTELEGYGAAPAYNQCFSDAIALAMEKSSLAEKFGDGLYSGERSKKKKNKKKVLFATSMVYNEK